jgi:cytochrome bd-type quinol oxidase subunit 1
LQRLRRIGLCSTAVTDRGLKFLERIPSLGDVWLDENDQLTAEGIRSLMKNVSGVRVHVMNHPSLPREIVEQQQRDEREWPPVLASRGALTVTVLVGLLVIMTAALGFWLVVRRRRGEMIKAESAGVSQKQLEQ